MVNIKDMESGKYNKLLAVALKSVEEFKAPDWSYFVKTGMNKVRPVIEEDFWYKRAASILRQIYIRGVVGTQRLRTRYGGRKNRGVVTGKFMRGGGKIIRVILQQSEAAGFVEKSTGKKKGRQLTVKGKEFLEGIK